MLGEDSAANGSGCGVQLLLLVYLNITSRCSGYQYPSKSGNFGFYVLGDGDGVSQLAFKDEQELIRKSID